MLYKPYTFLHYSNGNQEVPLHVLYYINLQYIVIIISKATQDVKESFFGSCIIFACML